MSKFWFFVFIMGWSLNLNAQAINTTFGKNRIQYHNDFDVWTMYETENFVTYWYGKSRNIAQTVIQLAEFDHDEVQKVLEHTISDKIEIIVYIDHTDLKQSNIGLEDAFTNASGKTKIQGHKMFVYFDGDHLNLRKQIRRGIAQVYLNAILYGSNFQEIVQNALLLNLPNWFGEGISAYAASSWDYLIDDELRDLLMNEPNYRDFEKFADEHPRAAGHSMWHYIAVKFDEPTIANIIYLTRINRNLENAFLFILDEEFEETKSNWYDYYLSKYELEETDFTSTEALEKIKLKNKKGVVVSNMKQSADGNYLAYVTNDKGKAKLWIRDLLTDKEKCILRVGHKNLFQATDFKYPLLAWHPTKPELSVVYEHRDVLKFRKVFVPDESYEEDLFTQDFQRIYSVDYYNDEDYILTASKDGFSDIYIFKPRLRNSERVSFDFYDDLDATIVDYKNEKAIVFRSNRNSVSLERQQLDTILPIEEFDLFLLRDIEGEKELIRLTETENYSELAPVSIGDNKVMYLSPRSGILNAYILDIESKESYPVTNFERNIIIHNSTENTDRYLFSYYEDGEYKVFERYIDGRLKTELRKTEFKLDQTENEEEVPLILRDVEKQDKLEITDEIMFQSEFPDPENIESLEKFLEEDEELSVFDKYFKNYYSSATQEGKRIIKYSPMRATSSRLKFRLSDFTTRMDNSVLFEGLESYTGQDRELSNAPLGILFRGTIKDLFEDYEIQVGLRLPTRFNGYEYFAVFDNKKYLWDKRFAFYRKAETNIVNADVFPAKREKRHTALGMFQLKYPFDVYRSMRFTTSLRFDKYIQLSTDPVSLNAPFVNEQRLSLKAEYIFDNSYDVSLNIKNGTRYKAYAEVINEFDLNISDGIEGNFSKAYTVVFGFDARHYIPVFRHAVLALRGTGASSLGTSRIVYYLGGMENWLFNEFDQSIPVPNNGNFSYKVLAPHLRGFKNNIRNGNTYLLSNVEFRVPVFRFLSRKPAGNSFFKNFQITGFLDAGLAWYGLGPNGEDNLLNSIEVSNPPDNPVITINARYYRDPLVMGYGFGFRSTLLGYYLKFDYAWGYETGRVLDPTYYISLGMDF